MSRLGFLMRDSAVYGGAIAVNRMMAVITFPLVARYLSVSDYGRLDLVLVLASLLATALIFGQDSAVGRMFYETTDDGQRRQLISQSFSLQVILVSGLIPAFAWLMPLATRALFEEPGREGVLTPLLLQVPAAVALNFSQNLLKWTLARRQFLVVSVGVAGLQATLMVGAIYGLAGGLTSILWANALALGAGALCGLYFIRRWFIWPVGWHWMRRLLVYAAPFGLIGVAAVFVPMSERALTIRFVGDEALGFYAAATRVAAVMALASTAFQTAWGPFALMSFREADASSTFNLVLKTFAVGAAALVLLLSGLAAPLLTLLASERYAAAAPLVFPLALGLAVQATSWILEVGISLSMRSRLNLFGYGTSILVTIGAIVWLAPRWGVWGVGVSVLLGHLAKAVVAAWVAQKAYPLPWAYPGVVVIGVWTCVVWLVGLLASAVWGPAGALVVHFGGLGGLLAGSWLALMTEPERRLILAALPRST